MTDRQTDRIAKSSHTYARVVNTNNTDTVVVCQEYFFLNYTQCSNVHINLKPNFAVAYRPVKYINKL